MSKFKNFEDLKEGEFIYIQTKKSDFFKYEILKIKEINNTDFVNIITKHGTITIPKEVNTINSEGILYGSTEEALYTKIRDTHLKRAKMNEDLANLYTKCINNHTEMCELK